MSKNIQINRYTGTAWEELFPMTKINNVYLDDTKAKFLNNGKIRPDNLDFADIIQETNDDKVVNSKILKQAYNNLTNQINGKKNTYVSASLDGWAMSDGTPATEESLSGNEAIVKSIGLTTGTADPEFFNIGDVILRTQVDVSDWWVGKIANDKKTMTLYPLETRKVDLNGYYTRQQVDSKIQTINTSISAQTTRIDNINNRLGSVEDNYISKSDWEIADINDGDSASLVLPTWDKYGHITGKKQQLYEKSLIIGGQTKTVKVLTTNDNGVAIPLASSSDNGVMSSDQYNTFTNFFRKLDADKPTDNLANGQLCITLVE